MENIQFSFIETSTKAYEEMILLRLKVLLSPIGIPRSYIDPQKEAEDILIGAYDTGQLIGCCILTRKSDCTVQLRQMAVDSFLQKKGIGKAILAFAEKVAEEKGYKTLLLNARDTVLEFYQRCGYKVSSEQFFEVGISHHQMRKELRVESY